MRTDIDLATMEGANESARTAVERDPRRRSAPAPSAAATYHLYDPPEFKALKRVDAQLYRSGLRNVLDVL